MSARDHELTLILQDLVGVLKAQTQGDVPLWRVNPWGDIIFGDSFEANEIHWGQTTAVGGTITREYRPQYVYHQNASLKLSVTNANNSLAQVWRYFSTPLNLTGVGFELVFMCQCTVANPLLYMRIYYYDGVNLHLGGVNYHPDTRIVDVVGTITRNFTPEVNRANNTWQRIKFTVDFSNDLFKNIFVNNVQANVNDVPLLVGASPTEPCIQFLVGWVNGGGTLAAWDAWIDDFMLTIKEPQL